MKIITIIFRTLLGLFLLHAGLEYFFHYMPAQPAPTGDVKVFMDGLMASKYLMPLVKVLEILCGLSFVSNKFVRLSAIVLLPISINIILINIFMMPSAIAFGAFVLIGNLFLVFKNWGAYNQIFRA
jgi:uncharacterized membrane protein YphA (DoxX/SURF4 family)